MLLVENHPDTLKYVRLYLERAGYHVRTAASLKGALECLREVPCDVLLSDIGLPDGTGWDLLEQAQLPPTTYALAMSGFGSASDEERSRAAGFRHHLLKPFNPDQLRSLLEEAERERCG